MFLTVKSLNKREQFLLSAFLGVLFIFLMIKGPLLAPDSGSYIGKSELRSVLYSLFSQTYPFLKGYLTLTVQLLLGIYAGITLLKSLDKIFHLSNTLAAFLTLLFFLPYYGPTAFGNFILSEALCYPFFLLFSAAFLEGIFLKKTSLVLRSLLWAGLLVLTRRQFVFLYPIGILFLAYAWVFEKKGFQKGKLVLGILGLFIGNELLERGYHLIYHNHFAHVPFTGIQMAVAPLYVSKAEDKAAFNSDAELKKIFSETFDRLKEKKLLSESLERGKVAYEIYYYYHFLDNYNAIEWQNLGPVIVENGIIDMYKTDPLMLKMVKTLIPLNLKSYLTLYAHNIILNMGGYIAFGVFIFLTFSAFYWYLRERHLYALLYFFVSLMTIGNYCLIALVEPAMHRYTIYTNILQFAFMAIFIEKGFLRVREGSKVCAE